MKLDKSALEMIVHNVFSYHFDENGYLHFCRFSNSQKKAYELESPDTLIRVNSSASVTFDFISDTDFLVLEFDLFPGSGCPWSSFDLYVDGIFYAHRYFDYIQVNYIVFNLPEGEHRITLYFPWSCETVVKSLYLSDMATIKPVTKNNKILIFGDSITQGYITEFASLTYPNQVARVLDVEILNQGVGGYYFGYDSIDESIIDYNPDLILIAYGTNDYSRFDDESDFFNNSKRYLDKLTGLFPDTRILAVLPIYRNDEYYRARIRYRKYPFDDARKILLNLYKEYKNISVLSETGIPRIPEAFAPDFLHPNTLGFNEMSKSITQKIKELLNI